MYTIVYKNLHKLHQIRQLEHRADHGAITGSMTLQRFNKA